MPKSKVLLSFFIIKIILDFFSPLRELNMVLQLCVLLPILTDKYFFRFLVIRKLNFVLAYFLIYVAISQNIQSVKIFTSVVFFCVFVFIGFKLNYTILIKKSKLIWRVAIFSFFTSLFISIFAGTYTKREFVNFEHVNLLGTYFVFLSLFFLIYYKYNNHLKLNTNQLESSPLILAVGSFLTLSTGAFVTQLIAFIPPKYYKWKNLISLSILLIFSITLCYFITKSVAPDLHQKIFGSLYYFGKEISINEFYQDTIHQNLELNNSANSGSFTWRIYSYTFYLHNIFNQNLLNFLFGSGVESFFLLASFAPHNDFIAVFLDFGLFGFLYFVLFLGRIFKIAIRYNNNILLIFLIFLILRLLFENVIYSSYVLSLITSIGGLLYGMLIQKK